LNRDFVEMLSALSGAGADYLLVGAYAMAAHGVPRATGDIDLWVRPDPANAEKVMRALRAFGAPLLDLSLDDLSKPGTVFQIGLPPRRIDILTAIDGLSFDEAWPLRIAATLDGVPVAVIGLAQLVKNKRATGRPKDALDVELLEKSSLPH
jgi:hypothetical protein